MTRNFGKFVTLCLSMMFFFVSLEARGEVTRLGSAIELKQLKLLPNQRFEDARGIMVSYHYRVGRVSAEKSLFLVARVTTGAGVKVRSLVSSATFRDRDGYFHGKKQLLTVPRNSWRQDGFFVPYYPMELDPGAHKLTFRFEAVSDVGSCKTGERPRLIEVRGENSASLSIIKPRYEMIQLLVRRIRVVPVATDRALLWRSKARPDLQWLLRFRAGAGGIVHTSKVRENTYDATWSVYSEPFPFSEGDRLSIIVQDEDFMGDDELGVLRLTLDQLLSHTEYSRALTSGKIRALYLGPVKVR